MTPQLSIIIPVYNTADYLAECLDSCLAQTFTDWECLIVDDASTDGSLAIGEAYVQRDERFRIIKNHHCGVAAARNSGMDAARGEWVGFADSDDRFRPTMFARMIEAQQKSHADVVIASFQAFESPNRAVFYPDFHAETPMERLFGMDDVRLLFLCDAAPWNKLFRREFLEKHHLRFPQGLRYEDILFWNRLVRLYPAFYYLPEKLYEYRQNRKGSTISSHTLDDLALSFFATLETIEELDRQDMLRDFGKRFPLRAFKAAAQASGVDRKQFVQFCRALFRHFYREHGKAGNFGLLLWAKSPAWLLQAFAGMGFPLRLRAFTQFLKKCDSCFHNSKECVL